jgi:hypothetical protein
MKTIFFASLFTLFLVDIGLSQSLPLANNFRTEERQAMYILLGWSGLSLAGSGLLAANGHKDQALMHASWAVINAGIAGMALLSAKPELADLKSYLGAEKTFNQILAINTGLDVAYVSTGLLMNYWGKSTRMKEFGTAVAIQGGFLLVFDAILFWRSNMRLNQGIELISGMGNLSTVQEIIPYAKMGIQIGL